MKRLGEEMSGASAVEFAIVSPLLIFFVLTAVYLGLYISIAHSVQQLAADGARASVAGLGDPERRDLTIGFVTAEAPRYFLIDGDRVGVEYASDLVDAVTVTVSYDASGILAWYPKNFIPFIDPTITRTAVVRAGAF